MLSLLAPFAKIFARWHLAIAISGARISTLIRLVRGLLFVCGSRARNRSPGVMSSPCFDFFPFEFRVALGAALNTRQIEH